MDDRIPPPSRLALAAYILTAALGILALVLDLTAHPQGIDWLFVAVAAGFVVLPLIMLVPRWRTPSFVGATLRKETGNAILFVGLGLQQVQMGLSHHGAGPWTLVLTMASLVFILVGVVHAQRAGR